MIMKCRDCGEQAIKDMTLCAKHREARKLQNKNKRSRRFNAGLCTECGKNKPMNEYRKCEACYAKRENVRLIRVSARKSNNCCTVCGRSKAYVSCWTNLRCAECHFREKFKWHGTKEQAEKIINDLLEKQNYRCALTGRDLRTNKYHIDHIVPRSSAPSRLADPTNWQLIVEDANMFKEGITVAQVLSLATDIVKKAIKDGTIKPSDLVYNTDIPQLGDLNGKETKNM